MRSRCEAGQRTADFIGAELRRIATGQLLDRLGARLRARDADELPHEGELRALGRAGVLAIHAPELDERVAPRDVLQPRRVQPAELLLDLLLVVGAALVGGLYQNLEFPADNSGANVSPCVWAGTAGGADTCFFENHVQYGANDPVVIGAPSA